MAPETGPSAAMASAPRPSRSPEERERLLRETDERGRKRQAELDRAGKGGITLTVPSPKPKPSVEATREVVGSRTCQRCGTTFELIRGATKRRFCSRLCRRQTWEAARAAEFRAAREVQPRTCARCGQSFTSPWAKTRYCSEVCRVDARLEKLRTERRTKVTGRLCKHCGRQVPETRRLNARYCDRYCKAQAQQARIAGPHRHRVSADAYARLLAAQGGRCAICGTESPGTVQRVFAMDHDHATGEVRGLLCYRCNIGIGNLGDDPDRIESAARFLRRPPSRGRA